MMRTDYCGALREKDVGRTVTAAGWVQTKRDMGGVIFIDLKDREGTLQVVLGQQHLTPEDFAAAEKLRNQSVIQVTGNIRIRSADTYNPRLQTGTIELMAEKLVVLSQASQLPFDLDDNVQVREDLRLKYRYLDLRRSSLYQNLKTRHKLIRVVEEFLDERGFLNVETPMLCKSTPEGARDYLVPSRVHPGSFYALPQSPQIYKQLLMVGGIDQYYQIARCFRDEDLRADRQPEFTQVDMEMSFVEQEDIFQHLESLFKHIMREMKGLVSDEPFLRMTWQEAMDVYGSDKPDLRFGLPIVDLTDIARECSFAVFRRVADSGGVVRAICVPGGNSFTRSTIDELTRKAQSYGAGGMAWIALRPDGEVYSILTKYFSESDIQAIIQAVDAHPGDFILFCADKLATVRKVLGALRLDLGDLLGLRDKNVYKFLFVTDFPQFEWSDEEKRWVATHHPFTMPYPEDVQYLLTDPGRVRAQAYDVVLNGIEMGSGSIRIHDQQVQKIMFEALGFSDDEIQDRFGFMVNAFRYGTPPHGGFAFGLDRLVMILCGADSLRDVIAFPKVKDASCPMTSAPAAVSTEQLEDLGLLEGFKQEHIASQKQKRQNAGLIDIENVANLARLSLTDEEKRRLPDEMGDIIAFANQLAAIDTEGVPITAHVVPLRNVFREDIPAENFTREQMLFNAPTTDGVYMTVPKTVE
ncbi:MAG TPA: aspartate--tRNA ligase [Candidatus Faecivivens stercoripullorum]|uniref:Multifunctional fusion protein n=1 Tax=Candidatus Faecivivens stercoripullorum TaxID=2840805 RepID=A0A9D1H7G7_9FIRM|nr:aspartate--tRNA ligase [Candidatus Faecivivens stercoripullorum]